jgi:hypothetical protein
MRIRTVALGLIALGAGLLVRARRRRARTVLSTPAAPPPPAALAPGPRFVSVPWEPVAPPGEDPELAIRLTRSKQMTLDRVDVRETPTQVFVTVIARWEPPAGGWFAFDVEETATVTLSEPLGDRELVHGATDAVYP